MAPSEGCLHVDLGPAGPLSQVLFPEGAGSQEGLSFLFWVSPCLGPQAFSSETSLSREEVALAHQLVTSVGSACVRCPVPWT